MDESDHLTLVNAGDEEVVSQEEGEREGGAAEEEGGGCCCASAIAIAHMRAHRARENSTRLGRVALTGAQGEQGTRGVPHRLQPLLCNLLVKPHRCSDLEKSAVV